MGWCFTVLDLRGNEECTVLFRNQITKVILVISTGVIWELNFFMEVQEEDMEIREEFVCDMTTL